MKLIFLVCLLDLFFLHSTIGQLHCGANEEYRQCGGCDQICNKEPQFCTLDRSNPGCYCKDGFVRLCKSGGCVPESSCPIKCNQHEEYRKCGGCDKICNKKPPFYTLDCSHSGCYCMEGYVRSCKGGECIPESSCMPKCPMNEVYKKCGGCDQINKLEPISCTINDYSSSGCYCKEGFIRACKDGACIKDSKHFCGKNEEHKVCGGCDEICNEEPAFCPNYCHKPGCYCKEGYVRMSKEGDCVLKKDCHKCRDDEVFNSCGPKFEDCCERETNSNQVQPAGFCQPGCYCKPGYVRAGPSNTTMCVPEDNCNETNKCLDDETEEYRMCGPSHQDSCDRKHCPEKCGGKLRSESSQKCVPGCFCKPGYIRKHADTHVMRYECVPEEECPMPYEI